MALGGMQPTISTLSALALNSMTANRVYSRYYYPPTGSTDINLMASEVYGWLAFCVHVSNLRSNQHVSLVYVDQKGSNVFIDCF